MSKKLLDSTDRALLWELDVDARRSFTELARRVTAPEETVRYRIKRLMDEGIILSYFTVIDVGKLGNSYYKVLLRLHNVKEQDVQELIQWLVAREPINWVARLDGMYQIAFTMRVQRIADFSAFVDELRAKFRRYLYAVTISVNIQVEFFSRDYLVGSRPQRRVAAYTTPLELCSYDDRDLQILRYLSTNARGTAVEIARGVGLSSETVAQRIRRMEQAGIITGYRVVVGVSKMGLTNWYVLLYANHVSAARTKAFLDFCRNSPHINYLIKALGEWQYELNIEAEGLAAYRELMMDLTRQFSDLIRDYTSMLVTDVHKLTLSP